MLDPYEIYDSPEEIPDEVMFMYDIDRIRALQTQIVNNIWRLGDDYLAGIPITGFDLVGIMQAAKVVEQTLFKLSRVNVTSVSLCS